MNDAGPWSAHLTVHRPDRGSAERLRAALTPEADREVPRARARIEPGATDRLELRVEAADSGALRAALNTYLGWVSLVVATEERAAERP